ncbi:MAG: adenosylcobalamin-dependent ribonucleoside-diphosphate reductase [Burkholderiaceae bacterium]
MKTVQPTSDKNIEPQAISRDVLLEKYAGAGESSPNDVRRRVAAALARAEPPPIRDHWAKAFYQAQLDGFIVGGRIASSAGTGLDATLINCFVQPLADSISNDPDDNAPGIFVALKEAAETMRRGGGVGYDFSPIRPAGALVRSTASRASGPVSYMSIFDRMCETVESAGARRGAQMAVLRCDHPDIAQFISAKSDGSLKNFNLSVACTDQFMQAVSDDGQWQLVHSAEPCEALIRQGASRRKDGLWVYAKTPARQLFDAVMQNTYAHAEPGVVFIDTVNRDNNLAWCEQIAATNPCGEQPLPPYGCCDLGSINLTCFVDDPFSDRASFDFDRFNALVPVAVRMLDNVLDVTIWPLPEQGKEAAAKRRIGLGFTGLGDALIMLGLRFDSETGRELASRIALHLRDAAYQASADLAREKSPFPLFDPARYGSPGSSASRLPAELRAQINKDGIRNSHLISIAPTGTISLAFADNASNGIEPAYSWTYTRKKRVDKGVREYRVMDHAWRQYCRLNHIPENSVPVEGAGDRQLTPGQVALPDPFVSALNITAVDHARMSMAIQPYVDSAISKTVNVASDYPYDDFHDLYLHAWRGGLKGLTTYRPNALLGSVLTTELTTQLKTSLTTPEALKPIDATTTGTDGGPVSPLSTGDTTEDLDISRLNQRIRLDSVPEDALAGLRWPDRPTLTAGNPAWTYMVDHPDGEFAVFIGHIEQADGTNSPFEVWVNGAEAPRGLGALAKTLSMDMRTNDLAWLDRKLRALEKAVGDDAFELRMPPHGEAILVPSLVAGFARLIRYRCNELKVFDSPSPPGPLMRSLMGTREPKAGPDGTMSWTVDVLNPATGDDFVLFLKELVMPDGQRRPYSMWLAGEYPRTLDGLCKALSLDMWVVDPAWIGMKLRKLLTYTEPAGAIRARIPGGNGESVWPSTVAWLAQLILHRYALLNLLDESGNPVAGSALVPLSENRAASPRPIPGRRCPECANRSLVRQAGCEFCTACGHLGACG